MKKYMVLALLLSSAVFAEEPAVTIDGSYECMGQEVDQNTSFTCQMTIKKTEKTYSSTATCSDGTSYRGTGLYDKNSSQLSTVFVSPQKAEETGISVAKREVDGNLVVDWTYIDKTNIAHSNCVKQRAKS